MSGLVLYDGDCGLCVSLARRFDPVLFRRGFASAPLQDEDIRRRLALPEDELLSEMRVLTPQGELIGGADAIVYLASRIWWALPLALAGKLPGAMPVLRAGYRWVAEHRGCRHGRCRRPVSSAPIGWLPLLAASAAALSLKDILPPWVFMWTISIAIFFGFKWWMFWKARSSGVNLKGWRAMGFLLLWPGMDARSFAGSGAAGSSREVAAALLKTALGAALFWGLARTFEAPLAAGWCGMIGLALILHCGLFHLASLAWRAVGADARPLMNSPLLASSLGDFWGNRWNRDFRQLSYELVFAPFHKTIGSAAATMAIFVLSGLIHDLVISFPAGGGYGLPTFYFVLQGGGLLLEKSAAGRRAGLSRGVIGRAFAVAVAAAPAYWLFHPPFVSRVIIPFMNAVGAL